MDTYRHSTGRVSIKHILLGPHGCSFTEIKDGWHVGFVLSVGHETAPEETQGWNIVHWRENESVHMRKDALTRPNRSDEGWRHPRREQQQRQRPWHFLFWAFPTQCRSTPSRHMTQPHEAPPGKNQPMTALQMTSISGIFQWDSHRRRSEVYGQDQGHSDRDGEHNWGDNDDLQTFLHSWSAENQNANQYLLRMPEKTHKDWEEVFTHFWSWADSATWSGEYSPEDLLFCPFTRLSVSASMTAQDNNLAISAAWTGRGETHVACQNFQTECPSELL